MIEVKNFNFKWGYYFGFFLGFKYKSFRSRAFFLIGSGRDVIEGELARLEVG